MEGKKLCIILSSWLKPIIPYVLFSDFSELFFFHKITVSSNGFEEVAYPLGDNEGGRPQKNKINLIQKVKVVPIECKGVCTFCDHILANFDLFKTDFF